jgi:hypothetical protein
MITVNIHLNLRVNVSNSHRTTNIHLVANEPFNHFVIYPRYNCFGLFYRNDKGKVKNLDDHFNCFRDVARKILNIRAIEVGKYEERGGFSIR